MAYNWKFSRKNKQLEIAEFTKIQKDLASLSPASQPKFKVGENVRIEAHFTGLSQSIRASVTQCYFNKRYECYVYSLHTCNLDYFRIFGQFTLTLLEHEISKYQFN
ncbi:hypothetical protein [Olivibacter sitiensis]|uniref:hypothetical protein n=1 Tax=Olivibacter sitiensis TaxID=376470 RepID=UPI0012FAFC87|nr:hypothetical protein [Olivibacter sitiensis]